MIFAAVDKVLGPTGFVAFAAAAGNDVGIERVDDLRRGDSPLRQANQRRSTQFAVDDFDYVFGGGEQFVDDTLDGLVAVAGDDGIKKPVLSDAEFVDDALPFLERELDGGATQTTPALVRAVPGEAAGKMDDGAFGIGK